MAPAALRDSVGNLPAELTSFVGRRRELAEIRTLLSESRLLTLTGLGGVGKTRLARRIAANAGRAFPDGVWQVELADLREPALLVPTIAASLGLREPGDQWILGKLRDYLSQRHLLLLLDNCEHLIDACALVATALLEGCPSLRILATSRETLAVAGEQTYPVPPLALPSLDERPQWEEVAQYEAVSLFAERARAALPGFVIDNDNRTAVTQLCVRLEGIPLAIELASSRMRALSADQILAQLDDRYQLLATHRRGAVPRQQSVHALVDWSYQLCSEQERLLWRVLSVFSGGFELDAALAMCAGTSLADSAVIDQIVSLVEKSVLVVADYSGRMRYRMPEIIKAFARDKLRGSADEIAWRRRHRDWYVIFAADAYEQWVEAKQLEWFRRVRHEHANIRAALEFSLTEPGGAGYAVDIISAVFDYWLAFGFLSEGRHWLEQALGLPLEPHWRRARALRTASMMAALQGDHNGARTMLDESRILSDKADDAQNGWVAMAAAIGAIMRGDLATAAEGYKNALSRFRPVRDKHGVFGALAGLVLAEAMSPDPERALDRGQELLVLAESSGERWSRSWALWAMGIAKWRTGASEQAAQLEVQSLSLRHPFDDRLGSALAIEVLAWIAASQRRPKQAAELFGAAQHALNGVGSSIEAFHFMVEDHNRFAALLGGTLGTAAVEAAVQRGHRLDFDQIIALATDEKGAGTSSRQACPKARPSPLTPREHQIAVLIAEGMTNKEIAAVLVIAPRTAEGHVEHILVKLGFNSRAQIAAWVAEQLAANA
jgi:predicted ATPase/DNA-binding CsgD family transcriptional regulator